jgi:hypothetical protein
MSNAIPAPESEAFKREDRYIVVKRSNISDQVERELLLWLKEAGIQQVPRAVVVEGDWPEYEPVWAMIEARCGKRVGATELLREALDCIQSGAWSWERERVLIEKIRSGFGEEPQG